MRAAARGRAGAAGAPARGARGAARALVCALAPFRALPSAVRHNPRYRPRPWRPARVRSLATGSSFYVTFPMTMPPAATGAAPRPRVHSNVARPARNVGAGPPRPPSSHSGVFARSGPGLVVGSQADWWTCPQGQFFRQASNGALSTPCSRPHDRCVARPDSNAFVCRRRRHH